MNDEIVLKKKGEELAQTAVRSRLAVKQLREVYKQLESKPLLKVEAMVKRQGSRSAVDGKEAWEMIEKMTQSETQESLREILWYAIMLHQYYQEKLYSQKQDSYINQSYPATCSSCGRKFEASFKPDLNRPFYCRECFQKKKQPKY